MTSFGFEMLGCIVSRAALFLLGVSGCGTHSDLQPPPPQASYFVATTGSSTGDGSATSPWDLATALSGGGGKVQPGDTIWLRGGTYRGQFSSTLTGTSASPIVVRQYPGDRATIDGTLFIQSGSNAWFWGFEVMSSAPNANGLGGIYHHAPTTKLINLVVHDASRTGIFSNPLSPNSEIYGCLVYNNGTVFNLDHGIYSQNSSGTKLYTDNIIFNNWKYGFHFYDGTAGNLTSLYLDGNVAFGNGTISSPAVSASAGLFVGGTAARDIRITNNFFYDARVANWSAQIGTYDASNQDVVVTGNTFVRYVDMWPWATATVTGNMFYGTGNLLGTTPSFSNYTWSNNTFYRDPAAAAWTAAGSSYAGYTSFANWKSTTGLGGSDQAPATRPSGVRVVVRPNRYEAGRANIIVYNWDNLPTASVDVSTVLRVGDTYEVRNVQDFYASPVLGGVYNGAALVLPMTGITPVAPLGRTFNPAPTTGPEFNVFVVLRTGP
jgi:hypothetical protein